MCGPIDLTEINFISVPRSEWTDDTARLAIIIFESEIKSQKLPGVKNGEKQFKRSEKRNANKTVPLIEEAERN